MLLVHCGWPRTGTTGLQLALARHRGSLADAGIVFPEEWIASGWPAHHGIYELVAGGRRSARSIASFERFLEAHAGECVLLSAEGVTEWLRSDADREGFVDLLGRARAVTPTRCVWTLRRFDDLLGSMYLMALKSGVDVGPPDAYFEDARGQGILFEGMRQVEELAGNDVAYVRYDAAGAHNAEILRQAGVPASLAANVLGEIERGPRVNASLTHKQAAAFLSAERLAAAAGLPVSSATLRALFEREGLRFEGDRPCEPVDGKLKGTVRERALAAARAHGLRSYVEFFGNPEADAGNPPGLRPDDISDGDLTRLVSELRRDA